MRVPSSIPVHDYLLLQGEEGGDLPPMIIFTLKFLCNVHMDTGYNFLKKMYDPEIRRRHQDKLINKLWYLKHFIMN